jgi:hypothetical protein
MSYMIGLGQHKQTKEMLLMVSAQPEPWGAPQVLNLLRVLKQGFPGLYAQVGHELIFPPNAKQGSEIPDEIKQPGSGKEKGEVETC